jgi:CRP/FNR family transcriptional regulator, cyclic AMP receptor protein
MVPVAQSFPPNQCLDRLQWTYGAAMPVTRARPPIDDAEMNAFAASHLRTLPEQTLARLTERARRRHVAAGDTLHRAGDDVRHVELVVRGLIRVHATAPDGRTLTLRYCRTGALMGILSLYTDPFVMPATTQALTDTDLLAIDPVAIRGMADQDLAVAKALLFELSERAAAFAAEIGGAAFGSVRQRVARHLLDLAAERQRGARLVAAITQQDLADAVGTVREVIVRTLRDLRRENLLQTGRSGIVIADPEQLLGEAYQGWNIGP